MGLWATFLVTPEYDIISVLRLSLDYFFNTFYYLFAKIH